MQRLRFITLIALGLPVLLIIQGCGQFFPGSNSITALQIAPQNASVQPGVTQQYTATATYGNNTTADVTSQVTWSTTLSSVATISSGGLLTAGALGIATVKAQSGSVIASTSVTVTQKQVPASALPPLTQTLSLSIGPTTVQFTATATYKDGSTADVTTSSTWTSVPSSVATISSTGLATAATVGTATVTATNGGITSNAATVTVGPVRSARHTSTPGSTWSEAVDARGCYPVQSQPEDGVAWNATFRSVRLVRWSTSPPVEPSTRQMGISVGPKTALLSDLLFTYIRSFLVRTSLSQGLWFKVTLVVIRIKLQWQHAHECAYPSI